MLATARASSALRSKSKTFFSTPHQAQTRTFLDSILGSALGPCPLRSVSQAKTLPYSSSSVFKAVSDVSGYPSFVPFAISSQILSRDAKGYPTKARLKIGYEKFGIEEHWESIVHCDPEQGIIEASSGENNSNGLFEVLKTRWKIESLQPSMNQTAVKLDIDVKFRNQLYDQMFAQVEGRVASTMLSAFEKRVQELEAQKR